MPGWPRVRGKRVTAETPAPVFNNAPTIQGTVKVGELLTLSAIDVTPSDAVLTYQWQIGTTAISGALSGSYVPVAAQEGATTLNCKLGATIFGVTTYYTTPNVGPVAAADPVDPPGDEFDGVDADTLARRAAIVAEFDGYWDGVGTGPYETTQTVSSSAALVSAWNALSIADLTKKWRILLDSAAPASNWSANIALNGARTTQYNGVVVAGHMFGSLKDWASNGGGVLIESSDTTNPVLVTGEFKLNGVRGAHVRYVNVSRPSPTNAQGHFVYTRSRDVTKDYCEASVVRFEHCNIGCYVNPAVTPVTLPVPTGRGIHCNNGGEQLDRINCVIDGVNLGVNASGIRRHRSWFNDIRRVVQDGETAYHADRVGAASGSDTGINAAWDERMITWRRGYTFRDLVSNKAITSQHSDGTQNGNAGDVGGYTTLNEFTAIYLDRAVYTDAWRLDFTVNPANNETLVIAGTTFTFKTTPSAPAHIQIEADLVTTLATAETTINSQSITNLYEARQTGNKRIELHFEPDLIGTVTHTLTGFTTTQERLFGSGQGHWNNQTLAAHTNDVVYINCIVVAWYTPVQMWNGTSVMDRCIIARPGHLVPEPSAFSDEDDFNAVLRADRQSETAMVNHTVRNSVVSRINSVDGDSFSSDAVFTGVNATLTRTNNRYATWIGGSAEPDTLHAGTFTTDADGRVAYTLDDASSVSVAAFRAALYAQLKLANVTDRADIGTVDPADWPTE